MYLLSAADNADDGSPEYMNVAESFPNENSSEDYIAMDNKEANSVSCLNIL